MAANTQPIYPKKPITKSVLLSPGTELNQLGAGGKHVLYKASKDGALIDFIQLIAIGNNPSCMIRFFLKNQNDISVPDPGYLILEQILNTTAGTPTAPGGITVLELPSMLPHDGKIKALRLAPDDCLTVGFSVPLVSGFALYLQGGEY